MKLTGSQYCPGQIPPNKCKNKAVTLEPKEMSGLMTVDERGSEDVSADIVYASCVIYPIPVSTTTHTFPATELSEIF